MTFSLILGALIGTDAATTKLKRGINFLYHTHTHTHTHTRARAHAHRGCLEGCTL